MGGGADGMGVELVIAEDGGAMPGGGCIVDEDGGGGPRAACPNPADRTGGMPGGRPRGGIPGGKTMPGCCPTLGAAMPAYWGGGIPAGGIIGAPGYIMGIGAAP